MRLKNLFAAILSVLLLHSFAQVKDKNWLLIDSVKYEDISPAEKAFLDSILSLYHKTKDDSTKLALLSTLAEALEEENVWTRYNALVYSLSSNGQSRMHLFFKANALNNMGFEAQNTGDMQRAINLYSEALTIRQKITDKAGIANSLNNLGYVFDDLGDSTKAEEYYYQGMKTREEIGDKAGLVTSLNNLGALYHAQGKFEKALTYLTRALKISEELKNKRTIGMALCNIGNVYRDMGDLNKALDYQKRALPYQEEDGGPYGVSGTYYNFASIYEALKQYGKAEQYAEQSLKIAQGGRMVEKIRSAAQILVGIYRHEKKFEKALDMHVLFIRMRDSTKNDAIRKASVRQQYKYEFEKKESILRAEQEKQNAIAEAEHKRQNLFLVLVGSIAIAVAIVAIVVARSLRLTRRQKVIIEKQKHMVEEKQKEILDSIHYAKRIQRSLLTSEKYIQKTIQKLRK